VEDHNAVVALTDLADATGLHPKEISLDGKLGLAIGARGKGSAMAHYELWEDSWGDSWGHQKAPG